MDGKWISYLRVSTDRQGKSGLGIEAQRNAVAEYLNGGNWKLVKELVEVESGKNTDRPQLAEAIKACRAYGAKLVIAKLDRLSRDAHFLLGLEKAGIDFVAADMPNANRLTVGIMAMVAEEERRMISKRTKDALAAAKRRGTKLGGRGVVPSKRARALATESLQARAASRAADIAPIIKELQAAGKTSLRAIADGLNEAGIPTARGHVVCRPGAASIGEAVNMGKVASTERLKVRATYWNGVAIALTSSGVVAPFISIYMGDFSKVSPLTFLVVVTAILAGLLCRWMAEATINEIKD